MQVSLPISALHLIPSADADPPNSFRGLCFTCLTPLGAVDHCSQFTCLESWSTSELMDTFKAVRDLQKRMEREGRVADAFLTAKRLKMIGRAIERRSQDVK